MGSRLVAQAVVAEAAKAELESADAELEKAKVVLEGHLEFLQPGVELASSRDSLSCYLAHHAWIPGDDNNNYYGVEATPVDVYGFNLQSGQLTAGGIWIASTGDGHPIPDNGIQIGWHQLPGNPGRACRRGRHGHPRARHESHGRARPESLAARTVVDAVAMPMLAVPARRPWSRACSSKQQVAAEARTHEETSHVVVLLFDSTPAPDSGVGGWAKGSPDKGCFNTVCPGFQKTLSSIAPGDVINPVSSTNDTKQYITVRVFKNYHMFLLKTSGNWHVHCGLNGSPKPVGYFPKSLLPAMIDRPVLLRFGGYAARKKPAPNPPMGNGYVPLSSTAALVSNLKLIDPDGNDHIVNTGLPFYITSEECYPLSTVDSSRFFYGGPKKK
ncbi:uncharacterized protein [Triticum aestivum]|uniref:uncharacterized protein n=1 Tax=Triticum aestivum TaxID=4565 RepID=UPI001D02E1BF|nr:uncharacterized protein LOC123077067 [Triticum aestivum]